MENFQQPPIVQFVPKHNLPSQRHGPRHFGRECCHQQMAAASNLYSETWQQPKLAQKNHLEIDPTRPNNQAIRGNSSPSNQWNTSMLLPSRERQEIPTSNQTRHNRPPMRGNSSSYHWMSSLPLLPTRPVRQANSENSISHEQWTTSMLLPSYDGQEIPVFNAPRPNRQSPKQWIHSMPLPSYEGREIPIFNPSVPPPGPSHPPNSASPPSSGNHEGSPQPSESNPSPQPPNHINPHNPPPYTALPNHPTTYWSQNPMTVCHYHGMNVTCTYSLFNCSIPHCSLLNCHRSQATGFPPVMYQPTVPGAANQADYNAAPPDPPVAYNGNSTDPQAQPGYYDQSYDQRYFYQPPQQQ